jgi:hypothetical protein
MKRFLIRRVRNGWGTGYEWKAVDRYRCVTLVMGATWEDVAWKMRRKERAGELV